MILPQDKPKKQIEKTPTSKYLTDFNPDDKPWDTHKDQSRDVSGIYKTITEFESYASRMHDCGGLLGFGWSNDVTSGESKLRLREAHFCRCRYCPVCQWRRALMWQARFYQALPKIVESHQSARWVFLTLTIRNCKITDLGATVTAMNAAFAKLKDRKEFKPVLGWVRTTEVTRGVDGSAHPHFHTLMMVKASFFNRNYVKQSRWVEVWAECLRVNYLPSVDIRTVKAKPSKKNPDIGLVENLQSAVSETLKYAVKPSDMVVDPAWFLELTKQSHKRRFVATGGILKNILKLADETDADLALADSDNLAEDDGSRIAFDWASEKKKYKRTPKHDKTKTEPD
jgi:plasmid rolling circle replication initiator protein Rep